MTDSCGNCGRHGIEDTRHDWDAVCPDCGQLIWLKLGEVVECKVARLNPFGIIVEFGDGIEGMVHVTELLDQPIRHPKEVVGVGSLIRAMVLSVDVSEKKIGLSRKRLAP
jgi:ribosomal protein S1